MDTQTIDDVLMESDAQDLSLDDCWDIVQMLDDSNDPEAGQPGAPPPPAAATPAATAAPRASRAGARAERAQRAARGSVFAADLVRMKKVIHSSREYYNWARDMTKRDEDHRIRDEIASIFSRLHDLDQDIQAYCMAP